jgi:uncharacterized protein (TIGR03435 family)
MRKSGLPRRNFLLLVSASNYIEAQSGPPALVFDVASFKRAPHRGQGRVLRVTPKSVTLQNASLGNCIEWAFGYQNFEVIGPGWRDYPTDVIYDIIAKSDTPRRESDLKLMFQALLEDRLGLRVHYETRNAPGYALMVAPAGPKITPSQSAGERSVKSAGYYTNSYRHISMAEFAHEMDPPFTSRHVIDRTGLSGVFDFTLDLSQYVTDPVTRAPILDYRGAIDLEGALLQALPQKLGLRLVRRTISLKMLVIDQVERDPKPD